MKRLDRGRGSGWRCQRRHRLVAFEPDNKDSGRYVRFVPCLMRMVCGFDDAVSAEEAPVGVDVRYESNPGEDVRDGVGSLLLRTCTGYLARARRVVFNAPGRRRVFCGFQAWLEHTGQLRSLTDDRVGFGAVFPWKAANDFDSRALVASRILRARLAFNFDIPLGGRNWRSANP